MLYKMATYGFLTQKRTNLYTKACEELKIK